MRILDGTIHHMRSAPPILLPLFRSDAQARVIAELYLRPEQELSLAELALRGAVPYATVHREIRKLLNSGIVVERRVGNARMVRAADSSPYFSGMRQLIEAAFGAVPELRGALRDVGGIDGAWIFGSYAQRLAGVEGPPPSDVDVIVVGSPDVDAVYEACAHVSRTIDRPVNPTILSPEEWNGDDVFVRQVRDGLRTTLISDEAPTGQLIGAGR